MTTTQSKQSTHSRRHRGPSPAVLLSSLQGAPLGCRWHLDGLFSSTESCAVSSLRPASSNQPYGCKLHILWLHVAILHAHCSIFKEIPMSADSHVAVRNGTEGSCACFARPFPVVTDIWQNGLIDRRRDVGMAAGNAGRVGHRGGPSGPFAVTLASLPPPPTSNPRKPLIRSPFL